MTAGPTNAENRCGNPACMGSMWLGEGGLRVCVYCQLGIKEMHLTITSSIHYVN